VSTAIHRRVEACRAGTDPTCIARLDSGWAVMGDPQVLPGYCLLLPDPVVPHLNAMPTAAQAAFLADMARLGDAVFARTGAVRINYALFGNVEPALHAHVFPRLANEPIGYREAHPWSYDWSRARPFDAALDSALLRALRADLTG
jgi:diadenosine tetraphosphate (Ap4A) HIT family hydrolase